MTWTTPKTNWKAGDEPGPIDFNRIEENTRAHAADKNNPHGVTKAQVGLSSVDNIKQMPLAGGTFTGVVVAQNNTAYTTKQIRNIVLSMADPSGGGNGDVWIKYI